MHRGISALREILGDENVMFSMSPCRISIRGGEEAGHTLNKMMEESFNSMDVPFEAGDGIPCPVCYSKVSSPVQLAVVIIF